MSRGVYERIYIQCPKCEKKKLMYTFKNDLWYCGVCGYSVITSKLVEEKASGLMAELELEMLRREK